MMVLNIKHHHGVLIMSGKNRTLEEDARRARSQVTTRHLKNFFGENVTIFETQGYKGKKVVFDRKRKHINAELAARLFYVDVWL